MSILGSGVGKKRNTHTLIERERESSQKHMCKHWSANSFALSSGHALGPLTASNTGLEQLKRWGSQRIPTVFWSPSTIHPPSLFEKTTKHAGLAGANQPRSNEARHPGYSREGPWLRHLVGGWRSSVRRISRLGCWTWGRVLKRLTGYYICCSCMFMWPSISTRDQIN